ncbi:MAG: Omp28-related outer membrane protein [Chitinophagales bacterium]
MKTLQILTKTSIFSLVFVLAFFTSACTEMSPYINFDNPTLIDLTCEEKANIGTGNFSRTNTHFISNDFQEEQCKMVLIEEFSGVRCVRCPAGHERVAKILEDYPYEVAAITMHAGFLSTPYPENKEDYVLEEGTFLYDFFQGIALPAAAIDRVKFSGEDYAAIVNTNVWSGKVNERLLLNTPINLYTDYEYNSASRELQVFVRAHYLESFDVSAKHSLTVSLSESKIIDYQLIPKGESSSEIIPNYEHNHVFRGMLTPSSGMVLEVEKTRGMVVERVFSKILPPHWKVKNMEIIAFVHDSSNDNILQTAKKHLEVE